MKVIVAVDNSRYSYQVVRSVVQRIWPAGCEFKLISIVPPQTDAAVESQLAAAHETSLAEKEQYLVRCLPGSSISSEVAVGATAKMILSAAVAWAADLIVIGSHGEAGANEDRIGSVATAVLNQAPCSVELIKVNRNLPRMPIFGANLCPTQ